MAITPMMQQYISIKEHYQDAFLFFRLGDFYEMFYEDAKLAARELEITLTSRGGGVDGERIPMCGVPYHSADQYIARLIEKGYKIAICEQVEDPKEAKGVVKREVVQLITPGTVMTEGSLRPKENNYLAAMTASDDGTYSLAVVDMTTGESKATRGLSERLVSQELNSFQCREVVVASNIGQAVLDHLQQHAFTLSYEESEAMPMAFESLLPKDSHQDIARVYGRLLTYLLHTQKRTLDHLQPVETYEVMQYMRLNEQTRRNLELVSTMRGAHKKGSLLWLLDQTKTAMGGRRLKQWIEKPLLNEAEISERLAMVEAFIAHFFEKESLRELLNDIYDLERLVGRISYGNVNARELLQLKQSLGQIPAIKKVLQAIDSASLQRLAGEIDPCEDIDTLIEQAISEDPPISITEGGMIKEGYDEKLDEYRYISKNGKAWLAQLEQQERDATGIKSLKIGYNKVFGYYIEVTKANLKYLPEGRYERKQTLTNAERYITPELKEKEKLIMEAQEKMVDLEYQLFQNIRKEIKAHSERLQKLARYISTVDVLQSLATVSSENNYVKPVFNHERRIRLTNSRHPVVEKVLDSGQFVANDLYMDDTCDVLLITGPNMGGKSTAMRQVALAAIMAQIGCFVPADEAVLPIFDQIFTRIGAADDLVSGQSTFMVEMAEAKEAVTEATEQSLILLDEIGRGTSTYDGIAIARSIVEFIHTHVKAKTLFSTHYHELTDLEQALARLRNVHVGAKEEEGRVVFLHKVMKGAADKSYGIHVAELAELPEEVIRRASEILVELEAGSSRQQSVTQVATAIEKEEQPEEEQVPVHGPESTVETEQLALFAELSSTDEGKLSKKEKTVLKQLKSIELLAMTPMDAMNQLFELQKQLRSN
ncbi:DNA mismatch repair protein MutS [Pullulanibacillus camelliae]|uniref:DNA mismatch repair protein MutS n=1 Tax=Pullulanibacillus camelliae TaxID=1707096 RepID=A0A8J2YIN8_9BACL|nr:DNA mismatch repair protein MutS [Pullulanibacillus camelliae]